MDWIHGEAFSSILCCQARSCVVHSPSFMLLQLALLSLRHKTRLSSLRSPTLTLSSYDCLSLQSGESRTLSSLSVCHPSPAPGKRLPLTANIFPVTPAANPSTCLAYCSTCLLFNKVSSLPGSCGNLNNLCHSSSGNGVCLANALLAFSDFRFVCHAVILVCSRASWR